MQNWPLTRPAVHSRTKTSPAITRHRADIAAVPNSGLVDPNTVLLRTTAGIPQHLASGKAARDTDTLCRA